MNPIQLVAERLISKSGELATSLQATSPKLAALVGQVHDALAAAPIELIYLVLMFVAATVLIGLFVAPIAGFSTYVERRIAGRMQARIGCNRVGPEGLLQFLADGLKLLMKEDTIPAGADQVLFRLAPYLVILGAFLSFVTIPFGKFLYVADLNVGLFYLLSVSSLVVVGILLAGWSSNNKWSLLGAMRSAAQIVSYEIPVAIALLIPVLLAGSMSLQDINAAQAGGMRHWFVFTAYGAPFIAFFIYFIAALAEVNRTPFDLPEAESELVAGYFTEYSGMRWGLFFVGEYANMFLISTIAVTCFLGGWQPSRSNMLFGFGALFFTLFFATKSLSYLLQLVPKLFQGRSIFDLLSTVRPIKFNKFRFCVVGLLSLVGVGLMQTIADFWLVSFLFFVAKVYFFVFVIVWIRWTLPRVRIDQLMALCWKKLVPIAFVCVFVTASYLVISGG